MKMYDEEKKRLAERLSEALEENRLLHDRLAELDITLNMDTVELKRQIENLTGQRDELLGENEFLLEDFSAKDQRIQELLRELEIKQLMIHETSSFLSAATDRIRNLERQCSSLESQYAGVSQGETGSGQGVNEDAAVTSERGSETLIEEIRREFEEVLGRKDLEIEALNKNMEELLDHGRSAAPVTSGVPQGTPTASEGPASLENTLVDMEHSLSELEQRISRASETGVTDKDELFRRLDDAHREIFSLRECHRSLLEALRNTDDETLEGSPSPDRYHADPGLLDSGEPENRLLRPEVEKAEERVREKEAEIAALQSALAKSAAEALQNKLLMEARIAESRQDLEERLRTTAERVADLEAAYSEEEKKHAEMEGLLQRKDVVLKEMHEHFLSDTDRRTAEAGRLRTDYEQVRESLLNTEGARKALEAQVLLKQAEINELQNRLALQQRDEERNVLFTERLDALLEGIRSQGLTGLPVVASPPSEKKTGSGRLRPLIAAAVVLTILAVVMFASLRRGIPNLTASFSAKKAAEVPVSSWASGVKQESSGDYEVGLTFLTKEAVHVLGFDDLISASMLEEDDVALFVIKTNSGCLHEDFVSAPEDYIRFTDGQGRSIPIKRQQGFSDWKKTVYKKSACSGDKPGAVYLKHIITAGKKANVSGLVISGLTGSPLVVR